MPAVDLLYVATGTTPGLRRSDEEMLRALSAAGASVERIQPDLTPGPALRRFASRSMFTIDLYECLATRRATSRATRSTRPPAIMYATSHAALLQSSSNLRSRIAIRFDTPAQLSRVGPEFLPEHLLERRRFRRADVLIPLGDVVPPSVASVLPQDVPVVPVPVPIDHSGGRSPLTREPIAVAYGGSPEKKGLDLIVQAWERFGQAGHRLHITGIAADEGQEFLQVRGITEPPNVVWRGLMNATEFRALTRQALLFLSASRYENYGSAQLEALSDGALLVTLPSPGPFVARTMARDLDSSLAPERFSMEALAEAIGSALEMSAQQQQRLRDRAATMLAGHSRFELLTRVRDRILPLLLG
jgi:hypothetical protein